MKLLISASVGTCVCKTPQASEVTTYAAQSHEVPTVIHACNLLHSSVKTWSECNNTIIATSSDALGCRVYVKDVLKPCTIPIRYGGYQVLQGWLACCTGSSEASKLFLNMLTRSSFCFFTVPLPVCAFCTKQHRMRQNAATGAWKNAWH